MAIFLKRMPLSEGMLRRWSPNFQIWERRLILTSLVQTFSFGRDWLRDHQYHLIPHVRATTRDCPY